MTTVEPQGGQDTGEQAALAERVEAASAPTFDLFAQAFEAIHGSRSGMGLKWSEFCALTEAEAWVDAAMTLVPENHAVNIDNGPCHWICLGKQEPMGRVDVKYPKPGYDGEGDSWRTVSAIAKTLPLALCAAVLRARAAQEDTP